MSRSKEIAALAAATLVVVACGGNGKPGPVLSSVTPNTGTIGTIVTIDGTNFVQSGSGTNPTVTFTPASGGAPIAATVQSFSATSLDVIVPQLAANLAAAGTVFNINVANPGGGSMALSNAFTTAGPVLTDVNGGLSGSGTVNSVFIVDGKNFGDLSGTPASIYSVDFRDASTGSVVASAAINFANSDWQDIFIVGVVPSTLVVSTTYKVTVTTPSGTSAPLNFMVVGSVGFSPATILWTVTSGLPAAQQGFSTVIAPVGSSSFIYALGGNVAASTTTNGKASNVDTVSFNTMDGSTGALANASWTATTSLPDKRGFAAAVTANAFNSLVGGNGDLYVLGGVDGSGGATSTVYYAALAADGTIPAAAASGTWTTTTPLPQPMFAEGAVIFHGRIYVAGGNDATGTPIAKVYSAKINADATLGAWTTLPDLPVALAYHQLVTSGGYLYVLGGTSASVDPISKTQSASSQAAVYYEPINIRNGGLLNAAWTTNATAMGKTREKFSAVVAGGYVLVSGGLYSGASTGSSEQSYAAINSDGSMGTFNGATGSHTITGSVSGYDFFNHAAAVFVDTGGNPHVLILGGEDVNTGAAQSGVWFQH